MQLRMTRYSAAESTWSRIDSSTARLTEEYTARFANPYAAAERGYVDDVIDPRDTRPRLIDALQTLTGKRDRNPPRKHGNIPL